MFGLKQKQILVGITGRDKNVILFTPPMCFTIENSRKFAKCLDEVLTSLKSRTTSSVFPPISKNGLLVPALLVTITDCILDSGGNTDDVVLDFSEVRTSSKHLANFLLFSIVKHMGGVNKMTFLSLPVIPTKICFCLRPNM